MSVVTELDIDSSGAEAGASAFSAAMASAAKASNDNLKLIADNTASLTKQMSGLGEATQAAAETSGTHWGSFVTKLALGAAAAAIGIGALYVAFKVLYEIVTLGPRLLGEAWDLGNAKLAEYVAIGEKAKDTGLTIEFYQRLAKAATDAKLPIDDLTAALKRLNDATAGRLGGSDGQKKLDALADAGNFVGNSGVGQFRSANSSEEKLRALVDLYDQALQKGERLAGLDLTRTILGDQVAKSLAADAGYLERMLDAADEIKRSELISSADVARAQDLQNRLDAAEKILSQRWHPIQDVLTSLGIKMKEAWVSIVELVASAFDLIARMIDKIPAQFWTLIKIGGEVVSAGVGSILGPFGAVLGLGVGKVVGGVADALGGNSAPAPVEPTAAMIADARRRLAEGLNRKFDTSHDPNAKPDPAVDTAAYDRAEEALRKYIETSDAAAKSVELNIGEQERLKAIAQLTAAGMKDGLTREAAAAKAEMSGLAEQAGAAALALAKAKTAADIKFGRDTAFLSQADLQIATQLKGQYADVALALASVEAQGLRANAALREISAGIETSLTNGLTDIATRAKTVGQGFTDMGLAIVKALDQAIIKLFIIQPLMQTLQGALGLGNFVGPHSLGGAPLASAHGNLFDGGNVIPFAQGGVIGSPTLAPLALMGESGPEAIVPLRRGADGNLGVASAGGAQTIQVTMSLDLKGANGEEAIARIASTAAKAAFTQAVEVANKNAPANQRRYALLGS